MTIRVDSAFIIHWDELYKHLALCSWTASLPALFLLRRLLFSLSIAVFVLSSCYAFELSTSLKAKVDNYAIWAVVVSVLCNAVVSVCESAGSMG